MRSKANWGYAREQLDAWHDDLTITSKAIEEQTIFVAECDDKIAGFVALSSGTSGSALEHLWIEPHLIGHGIGRKLVASAADYASSRGVTQLCVDADPNAEAFYLAIGARRIGVTPAPIKQNPRRERPQLVLDLPACQSGAPDC